MIEASREDEHFNNGWKRTEGVSAQYRADGNAEKFVVLFRAKRPFSLGPQPGCR